MINRILRKGIVLIGIVNVSLSILAMALPQQRRSPTETLFKERGYFYAYCVYSGPGDDPITFDNPEDLTLLAPGIFPNFCSGADMDEERVLGMVVIMQVGCISLTLRRVLKSSSPQPSE
jgi:hypothetical protein